MSDPDQPLFAGTSLAERIERAETRPIVAATEAAGRRTGGRTFVIPVAGGAACFADAGSPMNKLVGLGFGGMPGDAELTEIEHAFAALDTPVQVELSSLGDPQIAAALTGRDYRLVSFENVLGRALTEAPRPDMPDGVEVRCSDDLATWIDVVIEGFAHPDTEGVPSHEEFPRDIVENAERDMVQAGLQIATQRAAARFSPALQPGRPEPRNCIPAGPLSTFVCWNTVSRDQYKRSRVLASL